MKFCFVNNDIRKYSINIVIEFHATSAYLLELWSEIVFIRKFCNGKMYIYMYLNVLRSE